MVSPAGFEPATSPPQTESHTWLGYREMLFWSEQRDLNPQHTAWKAVALPVELCPHWVEIRGSNSFFKCHKLACCRLHQKPHIKYLGAGNGTRTRDIFVGNETFYLTELHPHLVLKAGLEPAVFRLSVERFNRLSYMSICWWKQWESNPQPAD